MSTATLISVSEYLAASYRPDCEMLEGRLLERNVGEYDHSNLQGALVTWLRNRHLYRGPFERRYAPRHARADR